ncbi:MAG TPA: alpha/beta family hydrolase [Thermomicrobiales bacterium]|nr:alpha/beta family hydrolase [Thermomicrobiales bacterium]
MSASGQHASSAREIQIPVDSDAITGDLRIPAGATAIVVFAHGSGSSRHSPRNRQVAAALEQRGLATLLFDLLTPGEERIDLVTRRLRFNIALLGERLGIVTEWLLGQPETRELAIGYFGASTGAAAALVAAAQHRDVVRAVVSRGGRPDLAASALGRVAAPTLLIVGERDEPVIQMNRDAMKEMTAEVRLEIVPGATHLFEEPGALEEVTRLAGDWFERHLMATAG